MFLYKNIYISKFLHSKSVYIKTRGLLLKGDLFMGTPIGKEIVSLSTYQGLDGSNFTLAGYENKLDSSKGYVSAFVGGASNFKNDVMAVLDLKGAHNYDKKGIINQNLRVRTKLGKETEALQIRYSPLSVDVPVGKNTDIYVNPHYTGQMDFRQDKWKNSFGVFAGVNQKLNKSTTVSIEAQRYNLQDIKDNSAKNWSINAIVAYKF